MKKSFSNRLSQFENSYDRAELKNYYMNKFYNLFMNNYDWNGIDYQQQDFIMRKFWHDGAVACFPLMAGELVVTNEDYPNGEMIFTSFAPAQYNIYKFPIKATPVVANATPEQLAFIPRSPLIVDKEIVLGWCQRNKKGASFIVETLVEKIINVEMVINMNLKAHKTPYIIPVTPENKERIRQFMNDIEDDKYKIFIDMEDANLFNVLTTGATYIIDKLYAYKSALENEILTYLGINNMGLNEKKEHLITAEVDSNNQLIEESSNCFLDVMQEFCYRIQQVFGYNISVEVKQLKEVITDDKEATDVSD